VNSILSAIGLALDAVGAVVLVVGLFPPLRPLTPGYAYGPGDAARDAGFAVAGATLLALGFVLQSLTYFGLTIECPAWVNLLASVLSLGVAIGYAFAVYAITYPRVYDRRREQGLRDWPEIEIPRRGE
jgi:hypothetical protein